MVQRPGMVITQIIEVGGKAVGAFDNVLDSPYGIWSVIGQRVNDLERRADLSIVLRQNQTVTAVDAQKLLNRYRPA